MLNYNADDVIQYSEKEVLPQFQKHYPGIKSIRRHNEGFFNLCFIVDTCAGIRFGKLHNPKKNRDHFFLEEVFTQRLAKAGIPIAQLIPTEEGFYHASTPLGLVTLQNLILGHEYSYTQQEFRNSAALQGKMHAVDFSDISGKFDNDLIDSPELLLERAETTLKQRIAPTETIEKAISYMNKIRFSTLPEKTLVHLDYHPFNLKFTEKGEVSAVLDFEIVSASRAIYDLGSSLTYFCRKRDGTFDPSVFLLKTKLYLSAYPDRLSEEEFANIPAMMVMRLVDNITRDLRDREASYKLNKSNIRNLTALSWMLTLPPFDKKKIALID